MSGATMLACESSLKVGTDFVHSEIRHHPWCLTFSLRKLFIGPIAETDETTIAPKAFWELEKDLDKATAVVLDRDSRQMRKQFLSSKSLCPGYGSLH